MLILGIETSCDETAAAVVEVKKGRFLSRANTVLSQINIHKKYGGVVPEIAARKHVKNIIPVIDQTLKRARVSPKNIDRIAVTTGPGLMTSLLVGSQTAKTLAFAWNKKIVPVNHLKAHLYANFLHNKKVIFPVVALIVSGGHTELILMRNATSFKKIGQTIDDAAGEAFDKVAQLIGLSYPGGPALAKLALGGDATAFAFPRPMLDADNFDFSFSGLKTAVRYAVEKSPRLTSPLKKNLAASFQQASVDVLVAKTVRAATVYKAKMLMLAGGVAANVLLRDTVTREAKKIKRPLLIPDFIFCTDNAAMIAVAGYFEKPVDWDKIIVDPNLEI